VTAGAGATPPPPPLPCRLAAPLWTWPGHEGQAAVVQALEEHALLAPLPSSSRRTLAAAARIGCVQGRLQGALLIWQCGGAI